MHGQDVTSIANGASQLPDVEDFTLTGIIASWCMCDHEALTAIIMIGD